MDIKLIPLSRLEADPKGTLSECADSGQPFVVELPDHRVVSSQALEPASDDPLIDELIESSPSFRTLVEKSEAGPRRTFPVEPVHSRIGVDQAHPL
jgi:hypothetical protein